MGHFKLARDGKNCSGRHGYDDATLQHSRAIQHACSSADRHCRASTLGNSNAYADYHSHSSALSDANAHADGYGHASALSDTNAHADGHSSP